LTDGKSEAASDRDHADGLVLDGLKKLGSSARFGVATKANLTVLISSPDEHRSRLFHKDCKSSSDLDIHELVTSSDLLGTVQNPVDAGTPDKEVVLGVIRDGSGRLPGGDSCDVALGQTLNSDRREYIFHFIHITVSHSTDS